MYPAAAKPGLRDSEGLPLAAEYMIGRHPDIVVADVAVRGVRGGFPTDTDVADDLDARSLGGHDKQRHLLVRARLGIGHRHHDVERREPGVGREPLLAVDHPVVSVAGRGGGEQTRI